MRATQLTIDTDALKHNLNIIMQQAPQAKVIAMVKSNAYGCGLDLVTKTLSQHVYGFGVACVAEAMMIRKLGVLDPCIIFEGPHQPEEIEIAATNQFQLVVHHHKHLQELQQYQGKGSIKVWIKLNTGMNRLGFKISELDSVLHVLKNCSAVEVPIGLMTHFACADEPLHALHASQIIKWKRLIQNWQGPISACNSAAIWSTQDCIGTHIRPGLALYGVSPFSQRLAHDLQLKPVMNLSSAVLAIHDLDQQEYIGYGATYQTQRTSRIAVIPVGYGDGYPRHIQPGTCVSILGHKVPIIGRVSMDKLTVDITDYPGVQIGDPVELWGKQIPIEYVALQSGTIPYELMCQVGPRERLLNLYLK